MAENDSSAPPPIQPLPPSGPPPPPPGPESEARLWNMWCHLSALAGFFCPFGNLLGPFIVWQIKKREIPSVEAHAKAALNFQLTVLIAVFVCAVVAFILSFFCFGYLLFSLLGVIGLCSVIFPIIAGVKANDGVDFEYPGTIRFLN